MLQGEIDSAIREHLDYSPDEHVMRLAVNDPKALAFEWIKGYAANLSDQASDEDYNDEISIDELIKTGMSHVTDEGWGDYISRGGAFEGQYTDPTFWDKLAILKDLEIPQEKRNNFFSCAC